MGDRRVCQDFTWNEIGIQSGGPEKDLQDQLQTAQQNFDQAKQTLEAAEKKANDEAQAKGTEVDDEAYLKEQQALASASKELEKAKNDFASFSTRPKMAAIQRPDLTMSPNETMKHADRGKRLYTNKYGCNACHRVSETGGVVGPALDRAGFRLNPSWVYRWIKYPQSMKPDTRMPNLGLSDPDAKAVAMYLTTLRAPRPEKPASEPKPIEKAGK
jgi:cytochrome c2